MEIKELVLIRLSGFGYEVVEADESLLDYLILKIEQDIKIYTNLKSVPEGLKYAWVDAVCGEILRIKFSSGKLENVSQVVKSIQEGDINVSFSESVSPEAQLLACLDSLALKYSSLVKYRVLTW